MQDRGCRNCLSMVMLGIAGESRAPPGRMFT